MNFREICYLQLRLEVTPIIDKLKCLIEVSKQININVWDPNLQEACLLALYVVDYCWCARKRIYFKSWSISCFDTFHTSNLAWNLFISLLL